MYRKLIKKSNLLLAWRRITTSGNSQYKRFYRDLYAMYEIALEDNINLLYKRLKNHQFKPSCSVRIYIPKPSGLQRPITLMYLEDQIVLQAFANILAERSREERKRVERKSVFSNFLNTSDSIFFIQSWRVSYKQYQDALTTEYNRGNKWVAHFDLASFYDTVSHDLLLRQLAPRAIKSEVWMFLKECLSVWTSSKENRAYAHGIPQGPSASDVLAEFFLLSIDLEMMRRGHKYFRYVDDIRLFGQSQSEVRRATIDLDFLCREIGLVPQSSKHAIMFAKKLSDVFGTLPSVHDLDDNVKKDRGTLTEKAENLFLSSLNTENGEIIDKSIAKYVLYRAPRSSLILVHVLRLLSQQPEFIDAFVSFLTQYYDSEVVKKRCYKLLFQRFPYDYVNGELWRLLGCGISTQQISLIKLAIDTVKDDQRCLSARLGAIVFLCECDKIGFGKYSNFIKYADPPLLQAFGSSYIPADKLVGSHVILQLLQRSHFEVSMAILRVFILNKADLGPIRDILGRLPLQTRNTFTILTGTTSKKPRIEFINEIISNRYLLPSWNGWKTLFGSEYGFALGLLRSADAVFDSNCSEWLSLMDSFNDTLYRCLQDFLRTNNMPGQMVTYNSLSGRLYDFGGMISPKTAFAQAYKDLSRNLEIVHKRRNRLPASHPYDKNTGQKATLLRKREQGGIVKSLIIIYNGIIKIGQAGGIQ